jgi:hypothetical protein
MFRAFCAAAAIALLGLLAFDASATAAPVFPPSLRVGLEPAGELIPSRRFPGFEDSKHHVAVTILELPSAAYDKIMRSATAPDQQGMTDVKRESLIFASGVGLMVSGKAQDRGTQAHRWFLIASAAAVAVPNLTVLIRVEVPEAARAVYTDAAVRKMLASVTFRKVPLQEVLGLLPFKLTDLAGFQVMKVSPEGVVIADSTGKKDVNERPYAIVSVGRGAPDQTSDRGRFARYLLTRAPLRDLKLTSAESMRIGGWPGYEIRADAIGFKGEPVALVQWLRFASAGGGFLRIIAVARKAEFGALFNRFRTLRDGVTLK